MRRSGRAGRAPPARPELAALGVEQPEAEGLAQTRPAVIRGAAADAHDHAPGPGGQGREQQLACPSRGGPPGISRSGRNQDESRGRGHLDHRRSAVSEQTERGLHGTAERPRDGGRAKRPPRRGDQRGDRALTPIGHRHAVDRGPGVDARTPRAIASAASGAVRLPLNLSGAITTRIPAGLDCLVSTRLFGDGKRTPA